jgi:hypothetical protein
LRERSTDARSVAKEYGDAEHAFAADSRDLYERPITHFVRD